MIKKLWQSRSPSNARSVSGLFAAAAVLLQVLPATAFTPGNRVSLTYSIEVSREGKAVKPGNSPSAGDQIKFHVQPSVDGYMYVVASTASNGEYDMLFPARGSREPNTVRKGRDYTFPPKGLTVGAGAKSVRMIFSKTKLDADPSMLMTREIGHRKEFFDKLGMSRPAGPAVCQAAQTGEITVALPDDTEDHPLELDIALGQSTGVLPINTSCSASATANVQPTADKPSTGVSETAPQPLGAIGNRYAVLFSTGSFKNKSWDLMFASKDARDFANFLQTNGKFPAANLVTLNNESATKDGLFSAIEDTAERLQDGDLLLIFIATRSSALVQNGKPSSVLLTSQSTPDNLADSSISESDLEASIKKIGKRVRVVLMLDTSHMGDPPNQPRFETQKLSQATGQMVLSSSSVGQTSHASLKTPNSIFLKYFMQGLKQRGEFEEALKFAGQHTDEETKRDYYMDQIPELKAPLWDWEHMSLLGP